MTAVCTLPEVGDRGALVIADMRQPLEARTHLNVRWAMDFMADTLADVASVRSSTSLDRFLGYNTVQWRSVLGNHTPDPFSQFHGGRSAPAAASR